jgi:hypothetical protein
MHMPHYAAACMRQARCPLGNCHASYGNALQVRCLRLFQGYEWLVPGTGLPLSLTELRLLHSPESLSADAYITGGQLVIG